MSYEVRYGKGSYISYFIVYLHNGFSHLLTPCPNKNSHCGSPKQEFLFRSQIGVINIPEQIHLCSASPAAPWSHIKGLMKSRTYQPHSALLLDILHDQCTSDDRDISKSCLL